MPRGIKGSAKSAAPAKSAKAKTAKVAVPSADEPQQKNVWVDKKKNEFATKEEAAESNRVHAVNDQIAIVAESLDLDDRGKEHVKATFAERYSPYYASTLIEGRTLPKPKKVAAKAEKEEAPEDKPKKAAAEKGAAKKGSKKKDEAADDDATPPED